MPSILTNEILVKEAVSKSSSIKEALAFLNLRAAGGNYAALRKACANFNIEVPRFDTSLQAPPPVTAKSNAEVFVENSSYTNRAELKKRMFAMGIPNVCSCGQGPKWNGKPLTLTLEHKNGVWNDNRLENLEILCPHCHSQTSTFAGKNGKRHNENSKKSVRKASSRLRVKDNHCSDCSTLISFNSTRCNPCMGKLKTASYPPLEDLIIIVNEIGFSAAGKRFGVSDNAIRKHLKSAGIDLSYVGKFRRKS